MHIGWHIAGDNRKYRVRSGIILALPYLFLVGGAYFLNRYHLYNVKWLIAGAGVFLVLWILTLSAHHTFRYPDRSYELTEYGLTIAMGSARKNYRWEEFRCFYLVGLRQIDDPIRRYVHKFNYEMMYLQKKKRILGFIRTYVVLYVPENLLAETRYNLGVWVGEKKPAWHLDFGLIHFEFK